MRFRLEVDLWKLNLLILYGITVKYLTDSFYNLRKEVIGMIVISRLTLLLVLVMVTSSACTSSNIAETPNPTGSTQSEPMEASPSAYYKDAELVINLGEEDSRDAPYCIGTAFDPNERECFISGYVYNNGSTPLEFYAELWGLDEKGRQFKSSDRYEYFVSTINPGMREYVRFNFILNLGVVITDVYLIDVGGPVSEVILSSSVLLDSTSD